MSERLHFYFDESGDFQETSTDEQEREASRGRLPSQIVGFFARGRDEPDEHSAERILAKAHEEAGLDMDLEVHASEIRDRVAYERLVGAVLDGVREEGWQPVRIANRQGVVFGDRSTTYVNMVAELVLRTLIGVKPADDVEIRVLAATLMLETEAKGVLEALPESEYVTRITEYLGRLAVRRGLGGSTHLWKLRRFSRGSGRRDRRLQICDILSNASWARMSSISAEVRGELRGAFGHFDFELDGQELLERLSRLSDDGRLGGAIVEVFDRLDGGDIDGRARAKIDEALVDLVRNLVALPVVARDIELRTIVDWLEQIVDHQRDLGRAKRLHSKLRNRLGAAIDRELAEDRVDEVAWFRMAIGRVGLMGANHSGDILEARRIVLELDQLKPAVVGNWEHLDLLLGTLVVEAVHLTDTFDHEDVCRRMKLVTSFYGEVGELFEDALPGIIESRPRSRRRGEAIGTWLQAETALGLSDPSRFEVARRLSELALKEFQSPADIARQHQYRAQLETVAGDTEAALRHLALGVGAAESTHVAIAQAIATDPSEFGRGFGLLHWLRLADKIQEIGASAALQAFEDAWNSIRAKDWLWLRGEIAAYPAHGILRSRSRFLARQKSFAESRGLLHLLERVNARATPTPVLLLVEACTYIEHAIELHGRNPSKACALLKESESRLLTPLIERLDPTSPALLRIVEGLAVVGKDASSDRLGSDEIEVLRRLVKTVLY